jgi:hypothetical protein
MSSVVLLIKVGEDAVLLGGDLEQNDRPQSGWNGVLNSPHRDSVARAFKIPHHGSRGAFSQQVWDVAIDPDAICVITPFSFRIAANTELTRLSAQNRHLFATAPPDDYEIPRSRDIQMAMQRGKPRVVRAIRLEPQHGQVRLRKRNGEDWRVDLFGSAVPIS